MLLPPVNAFALLCFWLEQVHAQAPLTPRTGPAKTFNGAAKSMHKRQSGEERAHAAYRDFAPEVELKH